MTSEAKPSKAKVMDAAECTEYPCLIFEDNFDSLDLDVWQHEISMSGGGVCIANYVKCNGMTTKLPQKE